MTGSDDLPICIVYAGPIRSDIGKTHAGLEWSEMSAGSMQGLGEDSGVPGMTPAPAPVEGDTSSGRLQGTLGEPVSPTLRPAARN
ncbi:MAG: hypothetical protein E6R03_13710 [Hyphomicrobiaceae bacterium]|nr:MAG: hypothetical protein E6R03_13710 [Hyphomicrobiaceae bacterium]